MAKDSDIETWSEIIDFSKGDYQDQLCRGWYELEHTEGRGYRWMGRSSTVFLPALGRKPKDLVVTGYPLVSRLPGKVENLSVYLNGYRLGHYALSKQDPFEIRAPVTEAVRLDAKVVTVTIEVDKTIPPSHQDQRELGIIISKIGFE